MRITRCAGRSNGQQQHRCERDDAVEVADPVTPDAAPGFAAVQQPAAHQDGNIACGSKAACHGRDTGEPRGTLRRADGSIEAAPAQGPRRARIYGSQIQRGRRQHLPRGRTLAREELSGEDPERHQRRPARAAGEQQRHDQPSVRMPGRDVRVAQRLDVARPVEQQIEREEARAQEPGLRRELQSLTPDLGCRRVIHTVSFSQRQTTAARF